MSDLKAEVGEFRTELEFEITLPQEGTSGVIAQQWARDFGTMDVDVRLRQPLLEDKPSVTETVTGRWRRVKVTGLLERDGTLKFLEKSFKPADLGKLKEWIEELKTYGALGTPKGQPVWGLSKAQFEVVNRLLSEPAQFSTPLAELTILEAVDQLLPKSGELTWQLSKEGREVLAEGLTTSSRLPEVTGISKGTALAILLTSHGLVFRPQRLPDGTVGLKIDAQGRDEKGWPIGWELETINLKRLDAAPLLFAMQPISVRGKSLVDLASRAQAQSKIPVLIDERGLEEQRIDPEALVITLPEKRTAWALVLGSATTPHRLQSRLRIDEAGKAFVWIDVFVPGRAGP